MSNISWKEYTSVGIVNTINENKIVIKNNEDAIDYILDNTKNKKEAMKFIDDCEIDFIVKNSKKIKETINKLPNNIF